MAVVSLVLCEDHRLLAEALAVLLEAEPSLHLVAPPTATGEDAVAICEARCPDVALIDLDLVGDLDGFEATRRIRAASPATKVVVLSGHRRREKLLEAVEAGACGYLVKSEVVGQDVVELVRAAAGGEVLVEPRLLGELLAERAARHSEDRGREARLSLLTAREREVLCLLARGERTERIASALSVGPRTVGTHVQHLLTKLGVHSRLEAVALAAPALMAISEELSRLT